MERDFLQDCYKMYKSFVRTDLLLLAVSCVVVTFVGAITILSFREQNYLAAALNTGVSLLNIWVLRRNWNDLQRNLAKVREFRAMINGLEASE
jgi:hypothetical protein